jgi:hypothetical protein
MERSNVADQVPLKKQTAHFSSHDLWAAFRFIRSLPPGTLTYIEEWTPHGWRLVAADACQYLVPELRHLTPRLRFRIRANPAV